MDNKVSLAYQSIITRAEVHSILEEEDYFITTVDNGIAFFSETNYNALVEKTLTGFRTYLESQGVDESIIIEEIDTFAANLVLHYIDHKSFSEERVQAVREQYDHLVAQKEEYQLMDATELDDITKEDEDETRL